MTGNKIILLIAIMRVECPVLFPMDYPEVVVSAMRWLVVWQCALLLMEH
jgi:hypothetical protein